MDLLVDPEPDRTLLDHVVSWQDREELLEWGVNVLVEGVLSPYLEERILAEATPMRRKMKDGPAMQRVSRQWK